MESCADQSDQIITDGQCSATIVDLLDRDIEPILPPHQLFMIFIVDGELNTSKYETAIDGIIFFAIQRWDHHLR